MVNTQTQYERYGYSVKEKLIPKALLVAAKEKVIEIQENQPHWATDSWQFLDPKRKTNSKGEGLPIGIQRASIFEEQFKVIAEHNNIVAAAEELLGGKVRLFTDQIIIKHGFIDEDQGGRSYYHQDSYYWKLQPNLGVNCWIPFDEVGKDAIALGIMPGSHADGKLVEHEEYYDQPAWGSIREGEFKAFVRHRIPEKLIDDTSEVILPMKSGDGLFFSNHTWHRSEPNRTGESKMFYATAYRLVP
jgi:ectoine hydroxylase-related dioxygenase (phytanoyl-CoA dioxygenase family)